MLKSQLICKEIHIFIIIACFARNFFLSLRTLITAYYKLVGKYVSLQNVKKQKIIKTLVVLGHSALEKYVWFVLLFPKQETDGVSNSFFSSMSMYQKTSFFVLLDMTYDYASEIRGTAAVVELDPHLELKHIGIWD